MCSRSYNGKRPARTDKLSRFRSSQTWTEKSIHIRQRDKYLCQMCLREKILNGELLEVHHIEPLNDNYESRLDDFNLITLCNRHHKQAENGLIDKSVLLSIAKKNAERN